MQQDSAELDVLDSINKFTEFAPKPPPQHIIQLKCTIHSI